MYPNSRGELGGCYEEDCGGTREPGSHAIMEDWDSVRVKVWAKRHLAEVARWGLENQKEPHRAGERKPEPQG